MVLKIEVWHFIHMHLLYSPLYAMAINNFSYMYICNINDVYYEVNGVNYDVLVEFRDAVVTLSRGSHSPRVGKYQDSVEPGHNCKGCQNRH